MKARIAVETKIVMELTVDEALWLKAYLQNFTGSGEEQEDQKEKRFYLFHGLKDVLAELENDD